MNRMRSDSLVQREAEALIREQVSKAIGVKLEARTLKLPGGATMQLDGTAGEPGSETVFVEIFAHQGEMKGGQKRKVAQDAFKLVTLGRFRPGARLVLALADDGLPLAYAKQNTWFAEAVAAWDIEVVVVDISAGERAKIRAAQKTQEMVNPGETEL